MFPTPFSGSGSDPNRAWKKESVSDGTWPKSLRCGFVTTIVAAVLMIVTALFVLSQGELAGADVPLDVAAAHASNRRVVAFGNIALALAMTVSASYLRRGSRAGRRWLAVFLFAAAFLNIAGFIVAVTGFAAIVIVALAAFAGLFCFRPAANEFIRECTWRRIKGESADFRE